MRIIKTRCYKCKLPKEYIYTWQEKNGCVHSICRDCLRIKQQKYRKTENGKKAELRATNKARLKHREKWEARKRVVKAIRDGELEKKDKCEQCNLKKKLQGHHEDYSKPLEIVWLCSSCHAAADIKVKNKIN
jgi:hypothetical protein